MMRLLKLGLRPGTIDSVGWTGARSSPGNCWQRRNERQWPTRKETLAFGSEKARGGSESSRCRRDAAPKTKASIHQPVRWRWIRRLYAVLSSAQPMADVVRAAAGDFLVEK